jgi:hypothetical protein
MKTQWRPLLTWNGPTPIEFGACPMTAQVRQCRKKITSLISFEVFAEVGGYRSERESLRNQAATGV